VIPKNCKRLAEVDFPIAEVSKQSAREKSIRHGHPSTLHLWWARRPLASSRAVLLALLWPDPSDPLCPAEQAGADKGTAQAGEEDFEHERPISMVRNRFFLRRLKEEMVDWDNHALFKERHTKTVGYDLTPEEKTLCDEVASYVRKRDTALKRSKASRKSMPSEFVSEQGCSSKKVFRQQRAHGDVLGDRPPDRGVRARRQGKVRVWGKVAGAPIGGSDEQAWKGLLTLECGPNAGVLSGLGDCPDTVWTI
jgi:hypothetical protein